MKDGGFEAVISSCSARFAVAEVAEIKIKIIANNKDVFGRNLVEFGEIAHRKTRVVIKGLWLDEEVVALFAPDSIVFLMRLPAPAVNLGIKI